MEIVATNRIVFKANKRLFVANREVFVANKGLFEANSEKSSQLIIDGKREKNWLFIKMMR